MKDPLVSVIVPTRNNSATIEACLKSVRQQTFRSIELIVVDNYSTDSTVEIASRYADKILLEGPERSSQRNRGAVVATGYFFMMIDSDMELGARVTEACLESVLSDESIVGVVIPEESFGVGFWSKCKRLERSFYVGVPWIEAPRFFRKAAYDAVEGYDEALVAGEDWDLSRRISYEGQISRIDEYIRHNEGRIRLRDAVRKKFYYARYAKAYLARNPESSKIRSGAGPVRRYALFLANPGRLFRSPMVGLAMLFMKSCEFVSGAIGYMLSD